MSVKQIFWRQFVFSSQLFQTTRHTTRDVIFPSTWDLAALPWFAVFTPQSPIDDDLITKYDTIKRKMKVETKDDISVHLVFSERGKPTYALFPGRATWTGFQEWQEEFIGLLLDRFYCFYIPAEKDLKKVYNNIVVGIVKQRITEELGPLIDTVGNSAINVSNEINTILTEMGVHDIKILLEMPPTLEDFFTSFNMTVIDKFEDTLFERSMGMQWLIISGCMAWISRALSIRHNFEMRLAFGGARIDICIRNCFQNFVLYWKRSAITLI